MIHIQCEQGSEEWLEARRGIPTASNFKSIITPKTRKPSAAAVPYMYDLLAEWATGELKEGGDTPWMQRGTEQEQGAIGWYELNAGRAVDSCGLFLLDDRSAGASPDGLVGDDGIVEVKCLSAGKHLFAVDSGEADDSYNCQIQGQLWITERKWCDRIWYNGGKLEATSNIVRVERDEDFIGQLAAAVEEFTENMARARERLEAKGLRAWTPPSACEHGLDARACRLCLEAA